MVKQILFTALVITCSKIGFSQCASIPTTGSCTGNNGQATNGVNINAGETYWYSNTGIFNAGVNINGGTLRICGHLTLNNLSFNSGTIEIERGGHLTINGTGTLYLNGATTLVIKGELLLNRRLSLQNNNNFIYVDTSGVFRIPNHRMEINSTTSRITNLGVQHFQYLLIQSNTPTGTVCLGDNSETILEDFTNNRTHGIDVPVGTACLHYSNHAIRNNQVTSSTGLNVCEATGVTQSGGSDFGNAVMHSNCMECAEVALPVTLINFEVKKTNETVNIQWSTSHETNNSHYLIYRSTDLNQWSIVAQVQGCVNCSTNTQYNLSDKVEDDKTMYYKIIQVDNDGTSILLGIRSLYTTHYPPTKISIVSRNQVINISHLKHYDTPYLQDYTGRVVPLECSTNNQLTTCSLPALSQGIYIIKTQDTALKFIVPSP